MGDCQYLTRISGQLHVQEESSVVYFATFVNTFGTFGLRKINPPRRAPGAAQRKMKVSGELHKGFC
jgi:hypothetical protein